MSYVRHEAELAVDTPVRGPGRLLIPLAMTEPGFGFHKVPVPVASPFCLVSSATAYASALYEGGGGGTLPFSRTGYEMAFFVCAICPICGPFS